MAGKTLRTIIYFTLSFVFGLLIRQTTPFLLAVVYAVGLNLLTTALVVAAKQEAKEEAAIAKEKEAQHA